MLVFACVFLSVKNPSINKRGGEMAEAGDASVWQHCPARVLVTGGSGFLGQFLLSKAAAVEELELAFTFRRKDLIDETWLRNHGVHPGLQCTLEDAESVRKAIAEFPADVIVHTAANSSPAACAKDPEGALAANAPGGLLDAIAAEHPDPKSRPLLIYLSTDQVFKGDRGSYTPDSPAEPVNSYGRSKLAFETMLQKRKGQPHVILRSSNIIGAPSPFSKATKFLQFLDDKLAQNTTPLDLFEDELRSFVHVDDVCRVILDLIRIWRADKTPFLSGATFHMGGPEPLSRVGLAERVAAARGFSLHLTDGKPKLRPTQRAALNEKMGYESPLDISMDSSALESLLGWKFQSMTDALSACPASPPVPRAQRAAPAGAAGVHVMNYRDVILLLVLLALCAKLTPWACSLLSVNA